MMAVRRQIYLWAGYVAFMILILFCVYKSSGAKSAANSAAVALMVFFLVFLLFNGWLVIIRSRQRVDGMF